MPRKIATLMLEDSACLGGADKTTEKALREVHGVLHAYVNPSTEAAYVEYDTDRCSEADLDAAVDAVNIDAIHPTVVPAPLVSSRLLSRHGTGSRTWWALASFVVIAAFVLFPGQRTSLLGALPFLFLLACLLLHRVGHGGHGAHGRHGGNTNHDSYAGITQEGIARDRDQLARNRTDHHAFPLPQLRPATLDRRRSES